MTADRPAAVLWDLDGTLIDSEAYWMAEETALVERFGGTWTHQEALQLVGAGLGYSALILQRAGVPWESDRIIDHLTDGVTARIRASMPWRPGARELLAAVRHAGVPTALVTMSIRRMAELVADGIRAADGHDAFDVIVSGSDVENAKPHPEAYLSAAAQLGVQPSDCVAIEDSPTGLASAMAAGAHVIGVPLMIELSSGDAPPVGWTEWPTLVGRSLDDLSEVLRLSRESDASAAAGYASGSASSDSASSDSASSPQEARR